MTREKISPQKNMLIEKAIENILKLDISDDIMIKATRRINDRLKRK